MATSRTGTAAYKRWRTRVLARGRAMGVTRCPDCGTRLDYSRGLRPESAEPDHLVPHSRGGRDEVDNGRVVCRRCNQSRGAKPVQPGLPVPQGLSALQASRPTAPATKPTSTTHTLADW